MVGIMNKYIFLFLFAIFVMKISIAEVHAYGNPLCTDQSAGFTGSCDGVAEQFNMTMKGFRLRKSGTDEFVEITTKNATYNFAAVDAGSTVASYLTDGTIPNGTYDAVSPILAPTISVSGKIELGGPGGAPCRIAINPADRADGGNAEIKVYSMSDDAGISSGSDAVEGMNRVTDEQYMNSNGDYVLVDSTVTGFPITVTDGKTVQFVMSISVAKSVGYTYTAGACTDSHPEGIEVSLSATVQ